MRWSEDRWKATWAGSGIQDLCKRLFLGLRDQIPPRDELISPCPERSDPGGEGGTEQHHNGPFDCSQTGWALRHPQIFMTVGHLRGRQLPFGNGRHKKTQAPSWTHGQEGTQQLTERHSKACTNPAACHTLEMLKQVARQRYPVTHAHGDVHLPSEGCPQQCAMGSGSWLRGYEMRWRWTQVC